MLAWNARTIYADFMHTLFNHWLVAVFTPIYLRSGWLCQRLKNKDTKCYFLFYIILLCTGIQVECHHVTNFDRISVSTIRLKLLEICHSKSNIRAVQTADCRQNNITSILPSQESQPWLSSNPPTTSLRRTSYYCQATWWEPWMRMSLQYWLNHGGMVLAAYAAWAAWK